jgi:leucyl-tRNA synthetase
MQRNWIGRSEGAHVDFADRGPRRTVTVFTTRPDTLFGATFFVVAADASSAARAGHGRAAGRVRGVPARGRAETTDIDRLSEGRDKTGVFLGVHAVNPPTASASRSSAADYVLADYGTGAIMAVPGQDQRDWEFAGEVRPADRPHRPAARRLRGRGRTRRGPAINSANDEIDLNGLESSRQRRR